MSGFAGLVLEFAGLLIAGFLVFAIGFARLAWGSDFYEGAPGHARSVLILFSAVVAICLFLVAVELMSGSGRSDFQGVGRIIYFYLGCIAGYLVLRRPRTPPVVSDAPEHGTLGGGLPKPWRRVVAVVLVLLLVGALLEMTVGERFIFAHADQYRDAMPWLLPLLAAALGVPIFMQVRSAEVRRQAVAAGISRWWTLFACGLAITLWMAAVSPLGWAAAVVWMLGSPVRSVEARVVAIEPPTSRRYCDQRAELEFRGATARLCVEGLVRAQQPRVGDTVKLGGRALSLGLLVERIDK